MSRGVGAVGKFVREFPMYIRPFVPFPLNKLIPFRLAEPVLFREQQRYSVSAGSGSVMLIE